MKTINKKWIFLTDEEKSQKTIRQELNEFSLNKWWNEFYKEAGNMNYEPQEAERYRINGYSAMETAKAICY